MASGGGSGNMPQAAATRLLDADPYVASWSGAYFDDLTFGGVTVPVIGEDPGAAVQPPVLSGHGWPARRRSSAPSRCRSSTSMSGTRSWSPPASGVP